MADLVLVLTTMPNDERAEELALTLINERLAACVNVHSAMTSAYRWKGAVEHEVERQLVIKTTRDRLPALESRLRTLHPYELAEFVVIDVAGGSAEYLRWVGEETRSEGGLGG